MREIIKNNPGYKVYDLSQNEGITPCQCRNCKIISKRYGSESGVLLWFVNRVANQLKKEFPDKYIGNLAYQYSQRPPTSILPESNVVTRLSIINTCLVHDYDHCPKNKQAAKDIEGWSRLTSNLFIWDYSNSLYYYYAPIPNFNAIQNRLVYYKENGVKGVLFEGLSETEHSEFAALRNYVLSKLMYDPYTNLDLLVSDFISHYYGNVAPFLMKYYNLTQDRAKLENSHLFYVMSHKNPIYSENYLLQAYLLLDQAEDKASQDVKKRVQYEKLSVAYMLCKVAPIKGIQLGAFSFIKSFSTQNNIVRFAGDGDNVDPQSFYDQMQKYQQYREVIL